MQAQEDADTTTMKEALWYASLHHCRRFSKTVTSRTAKTAWQGGHFHKQLKRRTLSEYEFGQFMEAILFKRALSRRFFQQLDTSGDGEVGGPEWRAAIDMVTDPSRRDERILFLFKLMDPAGRSDNLVMYIHNFILAGNFRPGDQGGALLCFAECATALSAVVSFARVRFLVGRALAGRLTKPRSNFSWTGFWCWTVVLST